MRPTRVSTLAALSTWLFAAPSDAQELVADRVAFERITWDGVEAFTPREIFDGLQQAVDVADRAHPAVPIERYVAWLDARITEGYGWAGFRDVAVEVRTRGPLAPVEVKVAEGPRRTAAPLQIDTVPPDPELAAAIRARLDGSADPDRRLWNTDGPARFGPSALALLRQEVGHAVLDAGALRSRILLEHVDTEAGRTALRIEVLDAAPVHIAGLRLDGVDAEEAARVIERIGFEAGAVATRAELRALVRALEDTGRFAHIALPELAELEVPVLDPLVIDVAPAVDLPPWDAMPWADVALLRRALDSITTHLERGSHLALRLDLDTPDPGDGFAARALELDVAAVGVRFRARDARAAGVALGDVDVFAALGRGLEVRSAKLGPLLRARFDGPSQVGFEILFSLRPAWPPEPGPDPTTQSMHWGAGFHTGLDRKIERGDAGHVRRIGPHAAMFVDVATASLVDVLRRHARTDAGPDGRLVIGVGADADAIAIDRTDAATSIDLRIGSVGVSLADGALLRGLDAVPMPDAEAFVTRHVAAASGSVGADVARLLACAIEPWRELRLPAVRPVPSVRFELPSTDGHRVSGVAPMLASVGRQLAQVYPTPSWPHVLLRDMPEVWGRPAERAGGVQREFERLLAAERTGPLGWMLFAAAVHGMGHSGVGRWCAGNGVATCHFAAFWADVEQLFVAGTPPGRVLEGVGARWREQADAFSPELAARLRGAADDRSAVRVGMDACWQAGLGEGLRALLRSQALRR